MPDGSLGAADRHPDAQSLLYFGQPTAENIFAVRAVGNTLEEELRSSTRHASVP